MAAQRLGQRTRSAESLRNNKSALRQVRAVSGSRHGSGRVARAAPVRPTILSPSDLPEKGSPVYDNCAFLIDKPLHFTSHDVCAKLKPALNARKMGHAGTLDLLATGLLIVCMGKGTKSSEHFMGQQKQYSGVFRLGEATPSYDAETKVSQTAAWEHISDADLQRVAQECFVGDIQQIPPIFSAIKVGGKKMYEAARAGESILQAPRSVTVDEFRVWRDDASSPLVHYKVVCSKGTYVRSLIHDLGQKVGSCAHVRKLRRDRSGDFRVEDAWQLDDLIDRAWEAGLPRHSHRTQNSVGCGDARKFDVTPVNSGAGVGGESEVQVSA